MAKKTVPEIEGRLRHIEGRHNALVKELRRAFAQGELTSDGHCAIEGVRIVEEALHDPCSSNHGQAP